MEGKLTWRLEWPAKWMIFGTSAEPFGKDHAAAGGSYDSGKRLVSEIFGGKAPYPIPYEFVQLKSGGQIVQMHKSLGSAVTGLDAIGMTPPEVLNYLFLRTLPSRTIDYDYGMGLLDMTDEYDRMERAYFANEFTEAEENNVSAYVIAQHNHIPEKLPKQISYRHLVNVVQMTKDFDGVLEVLGRTEDMSDITDADLKRLKVRVDCIKYWLDGFAPENVKFSIQDSIPADIEITDAEKAYFKALRAKLADCEWNADAINAAVTDTAKDSIGNKGAFKAMYRILIGKNMGPRLGPFLASMDRQFVLGRLDQASQ
jgi:lysyl-tRNA synthetase class 1